VLQLNEPPIPEPKYIVSGKIKSNVDETFSMEDIVTVHQRLENEERIGAIVMRL